MPSKVTLREMLEVGVHFGHRVQKWDPRMEPYIFTARNGIHILDLQQTIVNLHQVHDMVRDRVMSGGTVLFVGTKRQAAETIAKEAARCGMPYVNVRWLGGTLTNWVTIRKRIDQLKKLEQRRDKGEFARLTKKEALTMEAEIEKLQLRLSGLRNMKRIPDFIFIVDTNREATAVKECNILGVPIIALMDSNWNPTEADYVLPANDDAMRAISLMVAAMADAVLEGRAMRKGDEEDEFDTLEQADLTRYDNLIEEEEESSDETYLGESTLAKIRRQKEILLEDRDK